MSFPWLIFHNVSVKKVRSALTAFAVAVGVMTVVALGVVTESVRTTAAGVLQVGAADFTVAEKNVSDILQSSLTDAQLGRVATVRGVRSAVGVLLDTEKLDNDHPLLIEIGIRPEDLTPFGVRIVAGPALHRRRRERGDARLAPRRRPERAHRADDRHRGRTEEGRRHLLDRQRVRRLRDDVPPRAVPGVRAAARRTLAAVRQSRPEGEGRCRGGREARRGLEPGTRPDPQPRRVRSGRPRLPAHHRRDRAATIVAIAIGAIIVMNTMLLSLVERYREFGILRAIGWSRRRVIALVLGEALTIGLGGAAIGLGIAVCPDPRPCPAARPARASCNPPTARECSRRALFTAAAVAFLGALYPGAARGAPRATGGHTP